MKKELEKEIPVMEKKYSDLVWFGRSEKLKPLTEKQLIIMGSYTDECIKYADTTPDQERHFSHGFNSGMLACLRFFMSDSLEQAKEEFPFLDT